MLLARLEAGPALSFEQVNLVKDISPIHNQKVPTPGVRRIFKTFADIASELEQLPHIKTDPTTGAALEEPITPELNSLRAILFWRDLRNCVVHRGGLMSHAFCEEHATFFEAMREPYQSYLRPLDPMTRLQLPNLVFYAMASVHHRAAIFLNTRLQETSKRRRGTIHLPEEGLEEPTTFDPAFRPLPLLVEEDHPESVRWAVDETYRAELAPAIAAAREAG